jgi:hypothetical protein
MMSAVLFGFTAVALGVSWVVDREKTRWRCLIIQNRSTIFNIAKQLPADSISPHFHTAL